jgi:hypothetical protein
LCWPPLGQACSVSLSRRILLCHGRVRERSRLSTSKTSEDEIVGSYRILIPSSAAPPTGNGEPPALYLLTSNM